MVDELTQESFQTGKAIVTVSVDLITAIADACKRSEQQNPGMSEEQKETLLGKVVDKVMSNYKETHGSLKGFNREGKDVTHIDVNDERTAELLEKACKKSHIPMDMKEVTRADGSITHTAFCEVKSIDQVAALLKMASEQVLEEQKEMTKTLVPYDDKGKKVMPADFVNNGEINMDDVRNFKIVVVVVTAVQSLAKVFSGIFYNKFMGGGLLIITLIFCNVSIGCKFS